MAGVRATEGRAQGCAAGSPAPSTRRGLARGSAAWGPRSGVAHPPPSTVSGSHGHDARSTSCRAIAPTRPTRSRATAVTARGAGRPRSLSRVRRWWSRGCAFQAIPRTAADARSFRSRIAWLIRGGRRECHAASTEIRRMWLFPVRVIRPWRRLPPRECSDGTEPTNDIHSDAEAHRRTSPTSATSVTAPTNSTPRGAGHAGTSGARSHVADRSASCRMSRPTRADALATDSRDSFLTSCRAGRSHVG